MKKIKFFMISVLCFIFLFSTTGCEKKVALTSDEFKEKMESREYMVQDATSQMSEYHYVEQVYLAMSDDYTHQIEFYVLSDEDYARSFFNNNRLIFEESKSSGSSETFVNLGNYSKYTLNTDGKFKVVSRVDNTVIYLNVDEKYKTLVKDILEELGY